MQFFTPPLQLIRQLRDSLCSGEKASRKLVRMHLLAFVITTSAIISSFLALYYLSGLQKQDAHVINLSGKQRMLTQKTILLATKYTYVKNPDDMETLQRLLHRIHQNETVLRKRANLQQSPLHGKIDQKIQTLIRYKEMLQTSAPSLKILARFERTALELQNLFDRSTETKERALGQKIELLHKVLLLTATVLLLTVVAETLLIFRPAIFEILKRTQQLHTLNGQLHKRVEQAVAQKREQELLLMQKTKAAEMGELINNIAHQWRQPITIVNLYLDSVAEDLKEGSFDKKELLQMLQSAKETMGHMSETIDEFRSFFLPAKTRERFNLKDSILRVERLMHHHLSYLDIDVCYDFNEGDFSAFGRRGELEQCLMVLINNAKDAILSRRKNSKHKGGTLLFSLQKDTAGTSLSLTDDGGGIPKGIGSKIFEPYFSTKESEGTGVGLYMCKKIITDRFGGDLVFSVANGYTTFTIILPEDP